MKIFDKTKSFAPDIFFRHFKEKIFIRGNIAKNNKNSANSCEIYESNPICVGYCSILQENAKRYKTFETTNKGFFCIFQNSFCSCFMR